MVGRWSKRPRGLRKPDDVAKSIGLLFADRQQLRICTIGAVDLTKRQRKARRSAEARKRSEKNRRAKGVRPRATSAASSRPWEKAGKSRATWYRQQKANAPRSGDVNSHERTAEGCDHFGHTSGGDRETETPTCALSPLRGDLPYDANETVSDTAQREEGRRAKRASSRRAAPGPPDPTTCATAVRENEAVEFGHVASTADGSENSEAASRRGLIAKGFCAGASENSELSPASANAELAAGEPLSDQGFRKGASADAELSPAAAFAAPTPGGHLSHNGFSDWGAANAALKSTQDGAGNPAFRLENSLAINASRNEGAGFPAVEVLFQVETKLPIQRKPPQLETVSPPDATIASSSRNGASTVRAVAANSTLSSPRRTDSFGRILPRTSLEPQVNAFLDEHGRWPDPDEFAAIHRRLRGPQIIDWLTTCLE